SSKICGKIPFRSVSFRDLPIEKIPSLDCVVWSGGLCRATALFYGQYSLIPLVFFPATAGVIEAPPWVGRVPILAARAEPRYSRKCGDIDENVWLDGALICREHHWCRLRILSISTTNLGDS